MKRFNKILLGIGIIIALSLVVFYYLGEKAEGTVLKVQVVVKGDIKEAMIEDVTAHLESIKKLSEPKGTLLVTPGVTVTVIQNMQIIGEWTSVPYNGSGVYNLTVGLTKYPKSGDTISVVARLMDEKSQNIAVVSKEITLK